MHYKLPEQSPERLAPDGRGDDGVWGRMDVVVSRVTPRSGIAKGLWPLGKVVGDCNVEGHL